MLGRKVCQKKLPGCWCKKLSLQLHPVFCCFTLRGPCRAFLRSRADVSVHSYDICSHVSLFNCFGLINTPYSAYGSVRFLLLHNENIATFNETQACQIHCFWYSCLEDCLHLAFWLWKAFPYAKKHVCYCPPWSVFWRMEPDLHQGNASGSKNNTGLWKNTCCIKKCKVLGMK